MQLTSAAAFLAFSAHHVLAAPVAQSASSFYEGSNLRARDANPQNGPPPGMMWVPFQQPSFQVPPGMRLVPETAQDKVWAWFKDGGWKQVLHVGQGVMGGDEPTATTGGEPQPEASGFGKAWSVVKSAIKSIRKEASKKEMDQPPQQPQQQPGMGPGMWVPIPQQQAQGHQQFPQQQQPPQQFPQTWPAQQGSPNGSPSQQQQQQQHQHQQSQLQGPTGMDTSVPSNFNNNSQSPASSAQVPPRNEAGPQMPIGGGSEAAVANKADVPTVAGEKAATSSDVRSTQDSNPQAGTPTVPSVVSSPVSSTAPSPAA